LPGAPNNVCVVLVNSSAEKQNGADLEPGGMDKVISRAAGLAAGRIR
jgi:hypothetical protein